MNNKIGNSPSVLNGGVFEDERGKLFYNNDFDLTEVKRFYIIKHHNATIVRAWQGHKREHKFFKCLRGSFVVAWKKIDNFTQPNDDNEVEFLLLSELDEKVLSIPPGYVNGLKAQQKDSELMVFSDMSLEESLNDNYKFDAEQWLDWSQFNEEI